MLLYGNICQEGCDRCTLLMRPACANNVNKRYIMQQGASRARLVLKCSVDVPSEGTRGNVNVCSGLLKILGAN